MPVGVQRWCGNAEGVQPGLDVLRGLVLLQPHLGDLVQFAPRGDHLGVARDSLGRKIGVRANRCRSFHDYIYLGAELIVEGGRDYTASLQLFAAR